jgi:isocitrate lyase
MAPYTNGGSVPEPASLKALQVEQTLFDETVREISEWWASPRQKHISRPYSAKTVAALRGTQRVSCVANPAALKLWHMLLEHRRNGTAEMSFGATDPVAISQMAKHMRTVYLSGGLSGFSENNYPGMDHADYVSLSSQNVLQFLNAMLTSLPRDPALGHGT